MVNITITLTEQEMELKKNITVDHIYPGGVIGFKEKGQNIHSMVNKKHLKKGWHEDGEN